MDELVIVTIQVKVKANHLFFPCDIVYCAVQDDFNF